MTKLLRFTVALSVLGFFAPPVLAADKDSPKDPVIAKVNDEDIHLSEVVAPAGLPPGMFLPNISPQVMPPAILQQNLDQEITTKLLAKKGYDGKLDSNAIVKAKIHNAEEQIVAEAYVDQEVSKRITDDAVAARYKKIVADAPPDQQVHLNLIMVATEDEAKDIIKELKNNGDFAKLARGKSKDPSGPARGGDLGMMGTRGMPLFFAENTKDLDTGDFTKKPVQGPNGFYILKVVERKKIPQPTLEQMKLQIENILRQEAIGELKRDIVAKAKVVRYNPDGSVATVNATPMIPSPPALQPPKDEAKH